MGNYNNHRNDVAPPSSVGGARSVAIARLDRNPVLGGILVLLAAFVVSSLVARPVFGGQAGENMTSSLVYGLFVLGTAVFHLFISHRDKVFRHNRRLFVVFGLIFLQISLVRLSYWAAAAIGLQHPALITPMALAPVVLCVLLGHRMGVFAALYSSLLGALVVPPEQRFLFIIMGLGCGLVGIASTLRVRRRSRLIQAGLYVGFIHLAIALAFGVTISLHGDWASLDWSKLFSQVVCILSVELGTVILLSGLLPIFEGLADVTTDISWIELSDLNHPLLKRMTIQAPGTYHHSLMVATLAEAAAERVGANPTLSRVCSTFHDIGKLENPTYFVENQGGGPNPHDELTPAMSALKIIAHVPDGVAMAGKYKLNRRIVAVIREHHGDSIVRFFHHNAVELREKQLEEVEKGMRKEEDVCEINEADFRYPGPRPSTRESAIISLADAIESASRTLTDHGDESVRAMIESIVASRLADHQLSIAPLSLHELTMVQETFAATLKNLLHARVPYPTEKEPDAQGSRTRSEPEEEPVAEEPAAEEDVKRPLATATSISRHAL